MLSSLLQCSYHAVGCGCWLCWARSVSHISFSVASSFSSCTKSALRGDGLGREETWGSGVSGSRPRQGVHQIQQFTSTRSLHISSAYINVGTTHFLCRYSDCVPCPAIVQHVFEVLGHRREVRRALLALLHLRISCSRNCWECELYSRIGCFETSEVAGGTTAGNRERK